MSVSQGNVQTGPDGLTLRASAFIDAAAILKGNNVAGYSISGNYRSVTFPVAMPGTPMIVILTDATNYLVEVSAKTVNGCTFRCIDRVSGSAIAFGLIHFEVYTA